MDIQMLKALAERLRAHLESCQLTIRHGQALDLVAALPGLRNWPEVNAFPARVAAAQLDSPSAERLAKRVAKVHALSLPAADLLKALEGSADTGLTVWPEGPRPGVYVTASQAKIRAAISKYEAATKGALLYVESAGRHSVAAINLGEHGLFSPGMERLPSGTLVAVGPLALTQESWSDSKDRLNIAANLAYFSSLRIVVLVETPLIGNLHSDIDLLLRPEDESLESDPIDLLGIVAESGDLELVRPFVESRLQPVDGAVFRTEERLPKVLEDALRKAIEQRPYGLIVLGTAWKDKANHALLEAVLPLTDYAGPAARIQPTFLSGFSGEPPISPHFQGLPVFPSVESAHAHGFRRIILELGHHAASKAMGELFRDTCFLLATRRTMVAEAWMDTAERHHDWPDGDALEPLIALLCVADINTKSQTFKVCDAFVAGAPATQSGQFGETLDYLESHRIVRWEDQLDALLTSSRVTPKEAKESLNRHPVGDYLAWRDKSNSTRERAAKA